MGRRRGRAKKIPQELITANIDNFSHDGAGIARIEGKTTFVQGALPNETVQFKYTDIKNQYDKGVCVSVLSPSPLRAKPKCQYYDICGGCSLQHLNTDAQIEMKQSELLEHLKHLGKTSPLHILPPLTAATWGYRHKARLSVRYVNKKNKMLVGFREKLSGRFIADIERCEILYPAVGDLISELKVFLETLSNHKEIAQCEVAVGKGKTALILRHLSPFQQTDLTALKSFAKLHEIKWFLQSGGPDTIKPLEGNDMYLQYRLPSWDLLFQFKPQDFTQVNPSINEKMVNLAIELLSPDPSDKILDLFCGLGNFSLPLAKRCAEVVGVEGSEEMTERACMNAALNQIHNTAFFAADLFKSIEGFAWAKQHYDKLLLDPPRAGAKEICEQIERFGARRIVYVSCAPQTLARDTEILVHQKGYTLIKAGVMDMFPHTAHVESIALFEKKGG